MSSIHTARTVTQLDDDEARRLRRSGVQLVASAAAFLLGLICMLVGSTLSGTAQAEEQAAGWIGDVLVALPLSGAAVLLVVGVRAAARGAVCRYRTAGRVATGLAGCSALAWIFVQVASPLPSGALTPFVFPAVIASTALGSAAIAAIVVALRGRGVLPRTGRLVGVLGVCATVGAFFVVPPFAPYLLALMLGAPLARTRPSTRM